MRVSSSNLRGVPMAYIYDEERDKILLHLRKGPGVATCGSVWQGSDHGSLFERLAIEYENESIESVILHSGSLVCRTAVRDGAALCNTGLIEFSLVEGRVSRRLSETDFLTLVPEFERSGVYAIIQPANPDKPVYAMVQYGTRNGFFEAWIVAVEPHLRLVKRSKTLFW